LLLPCERIALCAMCYTFLPGGATRFEEP